MQLFRCFHVADELTTRDGTSGLDTVPPPRVSTPETTTGRQCEREAQDHSKELVVITPDIIPTHAWQTGAKPRKQKSFFK